jgi:hypothetical protein
VDVKWNLCDGTLHGFLRYAKIKCQCDRHYGWTCPKCKVEGSWNGHYPGVVKEAVDRGWVVHVVSYDLTQDGKRILDRLELRTI